MAIELLPPQLANQIAAGEVVERPASVVKELVENSLDAGASKIEIEIEKGGSKLIRIRDNGDGIPKSELTLALSRHATSKVHTLDDLEAILSFGFRGEALASVSSVSRLTLTSKTAQQTEAWQAFAEGSQMAVKVIPAAHPQGTTIEVADLFFNTPARRRFLKSDKTEFTHIDEWLKRIAMARTDIHFVLSHNGKRVRQYRAANTDIQLQQRIAQVCGKSFAEQALSVSCEHDGLLLTGYLQSPFDSVFADTHYFYVNGRLVRDRLVNHAVRQAFNDMGYEIQPAYILKLELDPHQVDVNVHPAKHEVRFHQARYVHDYILQALQSVLAQVEMPNQLAIQAEQAHVHQSTPAHSLTHNTNDTQSAFALAKHATAPSDASSYLSDNQSTSSGHVTSQSPFGTMQIPQSQRGSGGSSLASSQRPASSASYPTYAKPAHVSSDAVKSYAELLATPAASTESGAATNIGNSAGISAGIKEAMPVVSSMPGLLNGEYWVLINGNELTLLSIANVSQAVLKHELLAKLPNGLIGQPLLMPTSVKVDEDWRCTIEQRDTLLRKIGIELSIRYQQLIIKKVPQYIRETQLAKVIPELLQWIKDEEPTEQALAGWFTQHGTSQYESAQIVWQKYCLLDEQNQQQIAQAGVVLPWQSWINEQISGE